MSRRIFNNFSQQSRAGVRLRTRFGGIVTMLLIAAFAAPAFARISHPESAQTTQSSKKKLSSKKHPSNAHATSTSASELHGKHTTHTAAHRKAASARRRHHRRRLTAKEIARSHRIRRAFVASSQLRPMAQQLAQNRTPAAYAGVSGWAHSHSGEAASAAYLALGHAYLLDRKFSDAEETLRKSRLVGATAAHPDGVLADYADYLTAQAYLQSNELPKAELVLNDFVTKYADSIFVPSVPILQANLFTQEGDPQKALAILARYQGHAIAGHADFQLAQAKAEALAGNTAEANRLYQHIYLGYPLSFEAANARAQLVTNGVLANLSAAERRRHADALYDAGHYTDALEEYRSLAGQSNIDPAERNALLVAAAECDWKLNRLTKRELDAIPDSNDETGARRMYLVMELARDAADTGTQQSVVSQMETRFPTSPWLAEALYSSGNMYLLRKDYPNAVTYYGEVAKRFPRSKYAPSAHWRTGWLNYRLGNYDEAARLFDEQIQMYPGGREIPSALYWRAKLYEDREHNAAAAAEYYKTIVRVYPHYYYGMLAQEHLKALGSVTPLQNAALDALQPDVIPELTDDVPDDDPHVQKAQLLANAGLNEYIEPEIQAADGSDEWGAFAEAQIYASYGESWRAMRLLKRKLPFYTSAPLEAIPVSYWRILFPQNYWSEIKADAQKNGLDPYMVASLIRQETEFNPTAISGKSAYGLMQLLPSVGRAMAKQEGLRHFRTDDLLNPSTNILLGTHYLRQTLDRFGGKPEYAFAAYNAGDDRVTDWQSIGNYHGIDEFVESIPFTETREYVQAILRNEEMYRALDKLSTESAAAGRAQGAADKD
ncbi:MAG TPA: transglycosylase SLT domain-containing protein [Acidobacteriaceae bacterium]|nr:transglycosylase SLT domain-containing protein [Acidobacteriaceae bacterium]